MFSSCAWKTIGGGRGGPFAVTIIQFSLLASLDERTGELVADEFHPSGTSALERRYTYARARNSMSTYVNSSEHDLLAAAAWYQEGLPRCICEEHLMLNQEQSIGSFLLRRSYVDETYPFVLSVRTHETSVEHFFIERTTTDCYRIKVRLGTERERKRSFLA